MIYNYKILDDIYSLILTGKKKIEVRLLKEKSNNIKIGDYIVFHVISDYQKCIKTYVKGKEIFNNIDDLLEKENIELILPGSNKEHIKELLEEIYGKELKYGKLVAFHIEKISI